MISCAVIFDGRVTRVVYDDTYQRLLASCVKFNQRAPVARAWTQFCCKMWGDSLV